VRSIGYAQTVTFALLLARVEDISLEQDLRDVAAAVGARHTLMGRALAVLTDPSVLPRLAVSVETLRRVLAVIDWGQLAKSDPAAWLYFYERFLEGYDAALRQQTGSYYTPVEVVDPMVRLVEGLFLTGPYAPVTPAGTQPGGHPLGSAGAPASLCRVGP
jgi:hypothetical protein